MSELVIDLSDLLRDFLFVFVSLFMVSLAIDAITVFFLRSHRSTRIVAWLWFLLLLLPPLAGVGIVILGMALPLIELHEGLSK